MADAHTRHHSSVRAHGTDLPEVTEWTRTAEGPSPAVGEDVEKAPATMIAGAFALVRADGFEPPTSAL